MKKITPLIMLIVLYVVLPLVQAAQAAQEFTVFFSNDVHGEIEPCG